MSDEELSLRHRRASEASAGAPSATTRVAIRREAEAQAAARRATDGLPPAANDSHWPMRAVAGLAVVAIAVGLWWQLRPTVAQVTQVAQVEPVAQVAAVPELAERKARLEMPPPPAAVADSARAATEQTPLAQEIARRFPDVWSSATPVDDLWVKLDEQGKVVDAGRRTATASLARVTGPAASEAAAARAAAAGDVELVNGRGVPLRVSIVREPARP